MKITKSQLKRIVKEEVAKLQEGGMPPMDPMLLLQDAIQEAHDAGISIEEIENAVEDFKSKTLQPWVR
jgi:tryptophan synthase alpha subunit